MLDLIKARRLTSSISPFVPPYIFSFKDHILDCSEHTPVLNLWITPCRFKGPYQISGIEPGSVPCKASSLSDVLSFCSPFLLVLSGH